MFTLNNIRKVTEGKYLVDSQPCPSCGDVLTAEIDGPHLFAYNHGALGQDVFPDMSPDNRERFMTGFCPPCYEYAVYATDWWEARRSEGSQI